MLSSGGHTHSLTHSTRVMQSEGCKVKEAIIRDAKRQTFAASHSELQSYERVEFAPRRKAGTSLQATENVNGKMGRTDQSSEFKHSMLSTVTSASRRPRRRKRKSRATVPVGRWPQRQCFGFGALLWYCSSRELQLRRRCRPS